MPRIPGSQTLGIWVPPQLDPQVFLTIMIVHIQSVGIHNIYYLSGFISLYFQWLLLQVKSAITSWIRLSLQIWGWQNILQPQLSHGS